MTDEILRRRFPALSGHVYLNAASEGPMPADAVREAEAMARLKETPWKIGMDLYYQVPADVRARLAALVGAPAGSIALVAGTSAGIGLAAQRLPLGAGDEVLLLEAQFPSNAFPWRAVRGRGATIRVLSRPFGTDPTAALMRGIGPATRVIAVDWVNFVDGALIDLDALGAACRQRDIFLVVDGAQGVGALRLDVVRAGIAVLAVPSHKWLLGPVGLGFVYVAPHLLESMQSWNAGWVNLSARTGFRSLLHLDGSPPDDASRFESGSPAYALLAPWRISLDLLAESGAEQVERHVRSLALRALDGIRGLAAGAAGAGLGLGLMSPAPPASRSGIVSFHAGERTLALYRALEAAGFTVALREGAIRLSPHLYNTVTEIDALLDACRRFLA